MKITNKSIQLDQCAGKQNEPDNFRTEEVRQTVLCAPNPPTQDTTSAGAELLAHKTRWRANAAPHNLFLGYRQNPKILSMNKKSQAGEFTMFFGLFALFLVLGLGIAFGLATFFGQGYDSRQFEANTLNEKIKSCLEKSTLDLSLPEEMLKKEFLLACGINSEAENNGFLIILNSTNKQFFKIGSGDRTLCGLSTKNENFPRCFTSELNTPQGDLTITTGSNQMERKILT